VTEEHHRAGQNERSAGDEQRDAVRRRQKHRAEDRHEREKLHDEPALGAVPRLVARVGFLVDDGLLGDLGARRDARRRGAGTLVDRIGQIRARAEIRPRGRIDQRIERGLRVAGKWSGVQRHESLQYGCEHVTARARGAPRGSQHPEVSR
jgi:hypothetical protein